MDLPRLETRVKAQRVAEFRRDATRMLGPGAEILLGLAHINIFLLRVAQ